MSDPAEQLWYYHRLVATLSDAAIPRALSDELQRTVSALTELVVDDDPTVADRLAAALDDD